MTEFVLTGQADEETAKALCERASASHILGYPACAIFEQQNKPFLWTIDIYPHNDHPTEVLVKELGETATLLKRKPLPISVDWVLEGLNALNPVHVGPFFVHGRHDRDQRRCYHHAIQIEANQAFGTGHHGTTAGCLEAITRVTKYKNWFSGILDLGTGSGILAAALAKKTKSPVLATDSDPHSIKIASQNMRLNAVGPLVTCAAATGFNDPVFFRKGPFCMIVANILANPLRALAKPMVNHLSPNAIIILSGLLLHQTAPVLSAYRHQGCFLIDSIRNGAWVTLILKRT